jgi:hypothetical protein
VAERERERENPSGRRRRRKACRIAQRESERERGMSLTTVKLIIVVSFFFSQGYGPMFRLNGPILIRQATAACDLPLGDNLCSERLGLSGGSSITIKLLTKF